MAKPACSVDLLTMRPSTLGVCFCWCILNKKTECDGCSAALALRRGRFSLINYSIIFAERFYGSNKTADVIKHTHSQCTFLFSLYILHAVLLFSRFYYVSRRARHMHAVRFVHWHWLEYYFSSLREQICHKACCIIQAVVVLLQTLFQTDLSLFSREWL